MKQARSHSKMKNAQKVLYVILGLLIIVALIEMYLYVRTNYFSKPDGATPSETYIPLSEKPVLPPQGNIDELSQEEKQGFVYLRARTGLTNATAHLEYKGKIENIYDKNNLPNILGIPATSEYVLTLKVSADESITIYLTPTLLSRTEVVDRVGEQDTPVNITDLAFGDTIQLEMDVNLRAGPEPEANITAYKIVRLNE
ncbi:hypothetical protein HY469_03620 [Candidatus Roizmanbacteria bacterium]|nr:hypothetical protein [Candidatus Roizmanbacteria bacterium]